MRGVSAHGLSHEERRQLAVDLTRVLAHYRSILDAYIIEFFTDSLWGTLPHSWQEALDGLNPPQLATLLLGMPRDGEEMRYVKQGLKRVGLDPQLPLDLAALQAHQAQENRVVAFFSLALLLAPLVETLILLDRMLYLQEQGFYAELLPIFSPELSPRNLVLVATKTPLGQAFSTLETEDN